MACCNPVVLPVCLALLVLPTLAGALLLETLCCNNSCLRFSGHDPQGETGSATPTRKWVHGVFPRTSGCLRRLTVFLPPRSSFSRPSLTAEPSLSVAVTSTSRSTPLLPLAAYILLKRTTLGSRSPPPPPPAAVPPRCGCLILLWILRRGRERR